jgi:uncharacterized protein YdeI (BOF family)
MKLAIALTVLAGLTTTAAMACSDGKSAQNTSTQTSQQASTAGSQGTTQTQTRTN